VEKTVTAAYRTNVLFLAKHIIEHIFSIVNTGILSF